MTALPELHMVHLIKMGFSNIKKNKRSTIARTQNEDFFFIMFNEEATSHNALLSEKKTVIIMLSRK